MEGLRVALPMSRMVCPSCGGATDSSFVHCQLCGAAIPASFDSGGSARGAASVQELARLEAAKLRIEEAKSMVNSLGIVGAISLVLGIILWELGGSGLIAPLIVAVGVLLLVVGGYLAYQRNQKIAALSKGEL
jgi:hypothetical protein